MPIHANKSKAEVAAVPVTYCGETATLKINRNAMNNREWREVRQKSDAGDTLDHDFKVLVLCRVVTSWDVFADEKAEKANQPVAITKEALDELDPAFLSVALREVIGAIFPSPTSVEPTGSFA